MVICWAWGVVWCVLCLLAIGPSAAMNVTVVPTRLRQRVTYSFHEAADPVSDQVVALHHGICHTRDQFLPLIARLNSLGLHALMIDQQSENAGFFRNALGMQHYREGMAAALRKFAEDHPRLPVGSYALHSLGALIGQEMQQRYPQWRRPTVLMAPIPIHGALPISLRILRRHPLRYLKAVLTLNIHSLMRTPEMVRELFFDDLTPAPIVERTTEQLKHAPFWLYCQLVLRPLLRPRIRDDGLPKRLLFSETDEIFHPSEYRTTREQFPRLEEHHIRGGHDFFIEYAGEAAQQIAEFHQHYAVPTHAAIPALAPPHFLHRPAEAQPAPAERPTEDE